jgi:light-regulated signal transduction histidine kinase (bacteriophytochrome)
LEKAALSEEFEQAARDLETFSYAVSHDLRTPLRAVRMFSSIITQRHGDECSEEVKRLFGFVQRGAQQMDQLIDDLVRLTRVGRQPLSKQPIDLTALVRSVIQELLKDQGENRPDLRVQELPQAVGDGPLLHELYTNLLSNALKFTQGKHPAIIEVGSNHDNGECTYFVRDNGSGFDMKHAAHLFGVFCRLHAKDEFEGNGIGLAIVQRIIKRHGGQVWAEAEPGRGATFYFRLE